MHIDRLLLSRKRSSFIIGLHRVVQPTMSLLDRRVECTPPAMLEEIILYIRSLGYDIAPLRDVLQRRQPGLAAITFDDGFRDLYDNGYPILKRLNAPFTLFSTTSTIDSKSLLWLHKLYLCYDKLNETQRLTVLNEPPGEIGSFKTRSEFFNHVLHRTSPAYLKELTALFTDMARMETAEEQALSHGLYLTTEQIVEMTDGGMSCEAHGHEHWSLPTIDETQTRSEIHNCILRLEEITGRKPSNYCLAYGKTNDCVERIVDEEGLSGILTTRAGFCDVNQNQFRMNRLMTTNTVDLSATLIRLGVKSMI